MVPLIAAAIGAGLGLAKGSSKRLATSKENAAKALLNLTGQRHLATEQPSVFGSMATGALTGALLGSTFGGSSGGVSSGAAASSPVNPNVSEIPVTPEPSVMAGPKSANPWNTEVSQVAAGSGGRAPASFIEPEAIDAVMKTRMAQPSSSQGLNETFGNVGKGAMSLLKDKDLQNLAMMSMIAKSSKGEDKKEEPVQQIERPSYTGGDSGQAALAALIAALSQNKGGANRV